MGRVGGWKNGRLEDRKTGSSFQSFPSSTLPVFTLPPFPWLPVPFSFGFCFSFTFRGSFVVDEIAGVVLADNEVSSQVSVSCFFWRLSIRRLRPFSEFVSRSIEVLKILILRSVWQLERHASRTLIRLRMREQYLRSEISSGTGGSTLPQRSDAQRRPRRSAATRLAARQKDNSETTSQVLRNT